jgi:hypothetical protein
MDHLNDSLVIERFYFGFGPVNDSDILLMINCLTESKVLVIVLEIFFRKIKFLFSCFKFSKSKILSIKRFKRSDSEILCRNCFLTSLECRRRRHARFRLLHESR